MRKSLTILSLAVLAWAGSIPEAAAKPQVGQPAPSFSGRTAQGQTLDLSDLRGRTVVLEWTNKDCPFVRKHYGTGNMQGLQQDAREDHGVTWVSVISSAPGTQGYLEAAEALANIETTQSHVDHLVLDPEGAIGRAYDAQTTPQMFIIDKDGVLRFMGGIDDKPSSRWETVDGAKNYVRAALDDMAAGKAIAEPVTRPYGCSVKYAN